MSHALIADLGGTNARFAIVPLNEYQPQEIEVFACKEFDSFFAAATKYLEVCSLSIQEISAVVLAIAGPVNQQVIKFSNNPWTFTKEEVESFFGDGIRVALLNDFDAMGHSLEVLSTDDYIKIGAGNDIDETAPAWVIGPGTGLGVSCVVPQEKANIVLPGEGGHVDVPSCTAQEDYIMSFLRERHQRVSAERVLSGMGLENIYEALAKRNGLDSRLTAKAIGEAGKNNDALALEALEQFFVYLGRVVGDLVLSVESRGGVFIVGGIIPRYIELFRLSGFRHAMSEKGRMSDFVGKIPTFVVTAEYPGLMGCANYASYLANESS
ncbi:glucokinase [Marinomonas sp. 15G1-11]|uniref:Glucokinase n=1 Tax=Marinomonas phaeophyticola TaxID=3004091 RepID=A0ABT4JRZ2_9GAMM|nr:glucokinase [Marinomonas sp. 15G1-11]MCZ2721148.1 glucokinase [Marinomonas sp. 15G1-11]